MSFKIDKQTLDDLAIFGNNRTKSVYDIFNRNRDITEKEDEKGYRIIFVSPIGCRPD